LYQGTTLQLAEKVLLRRGIVPQRLKAGFIARHLRTA
jgi:hypothetical protein